MGENSGISWTNHTFNPWHGCEKVSAACKNCYAEAFAKRTGHKVWGKDADRRFFGVSHWNEPLKWNAASAEAGERQRVFCASMADVFEDRRDLDAQRLRLWPLIEKTPALDWLLLTKRPQHVLDMVPTSWRQSFPAHVWMGTTVEDQECADLRIPELLAIPATVRFLSMEPLQERVDLWGARYRRAPGHFSNAFGWGDGVKWVIAGGESGHHPRPFDLAWARALRDEAKAGGAAFFMKQMGASTVDGGRPVLFKGKGDDPASWPEDLQLQEFPA